MWYLGKGSKRGDRKKGREGRRGRGNGGTRERAHQQHKGDNKTGGGRGRREAHGDEAQGKNEPGTLVGTGDGASHRHGDCFLGGWGRGGIATTLTLLPR